MTPGTPADTRITCAIPVRVHGTRFFCSGVVHTHFMSTSQTAQKQGIDHGDFIIEALAARHSGKPPPSIFKL